MPDLSKQYGVRPDPIAFVSWSLSNLTKYVISLTYCVSEITIRYVSEITVNYVE